MKLFRRIITSAIACALAVSCAFSCHADDESSEPTGEIEVVTSEITAPQKITFLGDSIPAGVGLDGYAVGVTPPDSYPALLEAKYKEENKDVCNAKSVNLANSGDTSQQLWQKVGTSSFDNSMLASDVIVISIGGNDIMKPILEFVYTDLKITTQDDFKKFDTKTLMQPETMQKINAVLDTVTKNVETFAETLPKIISSLKEKVPKATIIVQTVYNPLDSNPSFSMLSGLVGAKISALNNVITSNAKAADGKDSYIVCDVATAFAGKSSQYTNIDKFDIHPNVEGHKKISELVDQIVKQKKYTHEEIRAVVNSTADSSSKASKMSAGEMSLTVGLFFGGFIILFAVVTIMFKKKQS